MSAAFPDTVTVEVTEQDIAEGKPCECRACPLALAFGRALGRSDAVVDAWGAYVNTVGLAKYRMPESAFDFMRTFDDMRSVSPGSFIFTRVA